MAIDDTIKTLTKIYQSIDRGIPQTTASPDALLDHLNDLYSEFTGELASRELFAYDDAGSPSITLTVRIDVEFDLKRVMENMRTRLHGTQHGQEEEIKVIKSNIEKQIRRSAASRSGGPFESQAVPSDDRQQREFRGLGLSTI